MRFRLIHKGLILILLPLACSLSFIVHISGVLERTEKQVNEQMRCSNILAAAQEFQVAQVDSGLAIMVYMSSHDPKADEEHLNTGRRLEAAINKLALLYKGRTEKYQQLVELRRGVARRWKLQRVAFDLPVELVFERMRDKYKESNHTYTPADVLAPGAVDRIVESEQAVDDSAPADRHHSMKQIYLTLLLGAGLSTALTLGLALFFNRNILLRLRNIKHNILQIAGKGTLHPPARADDEIAELDIAVHDTARQIKELETDKQRFIGIVANKLHSPLNSLRGTIGRLRGEKQLDERGGEHLSVADSNIDRLIRMVAELLSLDQLEESRLEMTYRRVNVQEVIKLSCDAVSEAAARAHVRVEMSSPDMAMIADHDRVVQVIVNLLANAIKFSPEGSTITVASVDAGENVQISVTDRGRGMPEEFRERLFARFAQAYESDSADKGGFGLGLSICKMIVDQHQGSIDVQSKLGEGTTFIISLPKEPPHTTSAAGASPSAEKSRGASFANFPRWLTADAHLWQKGILLVGLPLLFQIVFVGSLMFLVVQADHQMDTAERSRKFNSLGQWLRRSEMELAESGLYYRLVHLKPMLDTYYSLKDRLRRECDELVATATPDEHSIAVRLKAALERTLPLTDSFAEGKSTDSFDEMLGSKDVATKLNANLRDVDKLVQELEQHETQANSDMLPEGIRRDIQMLLLVAFGFNVCLAGALLVFLNRSITTRIDTIINNTRSLSRRETLAHPKDGSDEIASIDQAFYASAEKLLELERFKDEMVSMVSHDIRTPLTTINGALALAGVGAFGDLPPELQTEVASADTESNELISLINDLLTAEKSKSGNRAALQKVE